MEHGFDAGLGFAAGVAADDDSGWADEAEFGDEFVGEAHGFVGDDAPFDAAFIEFGDEFVHAVEEGGVLGVAAVVFVEVFGAPLGVVGMVGGDTCAEFELAVHFRLHQIRGTCRIFHLTHQVVYLDRMEELQLRVHGR